MKSFQMRGILLRAARAASSEHQNDDVVQCCGLVEDIVLEWECDGMRISAP